MVSLLPIFSALLAAIVSANAFTLPREVSAVTGLSDSQLRSLLAPPVSLETRASNCSATNTTGGLIKGPAPPTANGLQKRNAFVTRQGTTLKLLGDDFRIVGGNIYWLGLDENVIPDPAYPSKTRVLEAFGDISGMGGTAVRGHTLGISVGNPLSVEPSLDVFNDAAYESIDFAILAARIYGIKLLIPLIDNYNYYHGGKYQFIEWNGIPFNGTGANITPPDVGAFFYNTTAIVDSFKRYITQHLTHVNRYTGIALKDDPTILGWESGNELSGARFGDGPAPPSWTKEIGALVKGLAPKQLFMDGSYGIFPDTDQLKNTQVDIFGDHFYPANISKFNIDIAAVNKVERNFLAGEFDWTGENGGDDIPTFLSTIAKATGAGDFFWSLFGHDDECCQFVEHDDGESFYFLREDPTDLYIDQGKILVDHAAEITGMKVPTKIAAVACPQTIFPADLLPSGIQL